MAERGDIDRQCLGWIGDGGDRLRQPCHLPGPNQIGQREIRYPGGRAQQQGDDLGFTVELGVQFGLPAGLELSGQGDRKPPRQRTMG